jgi:hypothetical protein
MSVKQHFSQLSFMKKARLVNRAYIVRTLLAVYLLSSILLVIVLLSLVRR